MTTDALFQTGTDAALDDRAARAPAPRPLEPAGTFDFWRMVKAGPAGFGGGVSRYIASQADTLNAFGQVLGAYPEALGVGATTPEQDKQAAEQRAKLLKDGIDYSSPAGDLFRARAADLLPDPATAHWSDNFLGQIGGIFGDVAGATLGAGPLAPVAFGVSEGLAEADKLKQQGVPLAARTKAGAVAGAVQGASIVAPVVGRTALETLGLVAAAGPGSFVAQQAAEQSVLRHAGQEKIAAGYDPFDPWGLALSAILPGTIGTVAHILRAPNVKPLAAPKTEADIKAQVQLTPAEEARGAAYDQSAANLAELRGEIAKQKDPKSKAILEAELARIESAPRVEAAIAEHPELVDAARVRQVAQAVDSTRLGGDDLPALNAHREGVETALDQLSNGEPVNVADVAGLQQLDQMRADAAVARIGEAAGPRPVLAFHGTKASDAEVLDAAGLTKSLDLGPHFSVDPDTARVFAEDGGTAGRVLSARLHLEKTLDLPDLAGFNAHTIASKIDEMGLTASREDGKGNLGELGTNALRASEAAGSGVEARDAAAKSVVKGWLADHGYDSIRYTNNFEGKPAHSYIVLNRGAIEPVNPARGGAAPAKEAVARIGPEPFADFAARQLDDAPVTRETAPGRDHFLGFLRSIGGIDSRHLAEITGERGVRQNRGAVFRRGGQQLDEATTLAVEAGYLSPDALIDPTDTGGTRAFAELVRRSMTGERVVPFDQVGSTRAAAAAEDARTGAAETRLRMLGIDPAPARGDAAVMERYIDAHGETLANRAFGEIANEVHAESLSIVAELGLPDTMARLPARLAIASRIDYAATSRAAEQATNPADFLARVEDIIHGRNSSEADGSGAAPGADAGVAGRDGQAASDTAAPAVSPEVANNEAALQRRIEELAAADPSMRVRLPDGEEVTLAEALRTVADEFDADIKDAGLANVAAECFLRG